MFRNGFINMFKAVIQNVTNTEIADSSRQLCERLKKKTKRLREEDIKGPWPRDIQPGKCSDKVIDKCIFTCTACVKVLCDFHASVCFSCFPAVSLVPVRIYEWFRIHSHSPTPLYYYQIFVTAFDIF